MFRNEQTERLYGLFRAAGQVSTDSRRVTPGALFFALRGASFDGNRFARAALAAGAAAVVVDDPRAAGMDGSDERCVVVDDTLKALQRLATRHRCELGIKVLAITGSNGKTTTKELTAAVLSRGMRTAATQGNLNNHIGVPLTLLSIEPGTELAVIEMGASAQGEIAALCRIARPDLGIVTNVGRAHLEGFGGPEGIRRGKGELYDYLASTGGTALVRSDDPVLAGMARERQMKTVWYDASWADGLYSALEGEYNRYNMAAAVAAGRTLGIAQKEIEAAIAVYRPVNHRSQRIETERNTVIADCYNANPSSMRAALEYFAGETACDAQGTPRRKTVIAGEMYELGEWSAAEHETVVRRLCAMGIEALLVGKAFVEALAGLRAQGDVETSRLTAFEDRQALEAYLDAHPISGRFVLLKGSHAVGLERLLERL